MSWRQDMLPASFRGATFYINDHERLGGRRVVVSEYPLRDRVSTEDLGRSVRKFELTGYVVGDNYFAERDALIAACEDYETVGTLVHPYLGELRVRCQNVGLRERVTEGRVATFLLGFVDAGEVRPKAPLDTRGGWLDTIKTAYAVGQQAFKIYTTLRGLPTSLLLAWAGDYALGSLSAYVGLPRISLAQVQDALNGLSRVAGDDPLAVAAAIQAPSQALANAALATSPPAASASAATNTIGSTASTSRDDGEDPARLVSAVLLRPPAPRTLGIRQTPDELATLLALDALAYGAAVLASAQVLADVRWPNAAAAVAARDALLEAADVCAIAAADANQDALYAAWQAFSAAASVDMTARAVRAPQLGAYKSPRPIGSLALAHRLYQDARRADELVALNAVPHPAFLPASGVALVA